VSCSHAIGAHPFSVVAIKVARARDHSHFRQLAGDLDAESEDLKRVGDQDSPIDAREIREELGHLEQRFIDFGHLRSRARLVESHPTDPVESRDLYDLLLERYRTGSVIVTSNRGPDEWLATFADPVRAQSAIDRFTSNVYDLVIDGESYRPRLKPRLAKEGKERPRCPTPPATTTRGRSAAAISHRCCRSRPPPSARRLSADQSGGRKCRQKSATWGTLTASDARAGEWTSQGGKVLKI
jgi:hypothetical protein